MLDFVSKSLTKIFGTKSDKDLKLIKPAVELIHKESAKLANISDDELRNKTLQIKAFIAQDLKEIDDKIKEQQNSVESNPKLTLQEKDVIFNAIDKLLKERDEALDTTLQKVLPVAFAVVKETAKRLKENGQLVVTATDHDRMIASERQGVTIDGEQAIWHNTWLAAGNEIKWEMVHYDVQLIGGMVLHEGKIAEMATGEGKTLVATLPAYLRALAGNGVHIVTVNDYLAKRDSEWMGPLFEFHLMRVDCIDKHPSNSERRRRAYAADITYGTNNEFGFDYLRDNMVHEPNEMVQRRHYFAMVDEVDSVLVDDARTPLIISGPVQDGDIHEYEAFKARIEKLYNEQLKLTLEFLNDAKRKIEAGNQNEGGLSLFRAHKAMPKYKPLIKFLGQTGMKQLMQKTENIYLADNSRLMPEATEPLFFTIEEKNNSVNLTEKGVNAITASGDDANFFVLPDLATELAKIDKYFQALKDATRGNNELPEEQKEESLTKIQSDYNDARLKCTQDYTTKAGRIHTITQLLKAYTLFEKDVEYVVMDGKVKIVDEGTGRILDGRRFSDGLHQALEAKENVHIEDASQTYATITLQNYFRMYHKLAGMTGTAETEAAEFWDIYKLDVVVIPTNKIIARHDEEDKVYKTVREKFNAVALEIQSMVSKGRPVLVGTTSVENSELLSRMLQRQNIVHQVLNAKQHAKEAEIVANAGVEGAVTIATNMAGRGTDIKLTPAAKAAGGLAIIGTERHESRRVDRQLRGRSGRQGDPGSSQFFVSLEDNLMRMFGSDKIAKVMDTLGLKEGEVIQHSMITKSIERAQKKVEENNFGQRKRLLDYDNVMNAQRLAIYKRRKNALFGERLSNDLVNIFGECAENIDIKNSANPEQHEFLAQTVMGVSMRNEENKNLNLFQVAFSNYIKRKEMLRHAIENFLSAILSNEEMKARGGEAFINIEVSENRRVSLVVNFERNLMMIPFTNGKYNFFIEAPLDQILESKGRLVMQKLEQMVVLNLIDNEWKEHLRSMDDLRTQVQMATIEQKDPLVIYKVQSMDLFKRFLADVNDSVVSFLSFVDMAQLTPTDTNPIQRRRRKQAPPVRQTSSNTQTEENNSDTEQPNTAAKKQTPDNIIKHTAPRTSDRTYGRNDRVNVRYVDGTIRKNIKFKDVEQDLASGKCLLIA
ncbi:MAG: preprotein translocase subunit SecA [Cytophagales bacterium]|nr:MAG: preprotein translocase subunit SecA [Cytophagales bacterium]TAF61968.1 MAG: preprotein translocase subunit SecA [Cytophagales bacterium]